MTPSDARANTNLQKVRLFSKESLSKTAVDGTWDRAKIVCTQPFNKHQPFGLSFVSFMTDEERAKDTSGNI